MAGRYDGEIVGADSRQVYRYMDIGTAKPTAEERAATPHHLVDVVDPDAPFSLAAWLELAREAIEGIWLRGRLPLVVGGTGQYMWALLEGWLVARVPPQPALREEMAARPPDELLAELRRVDPEAEAYIDPQNVRRVVRALEVQAITGKPFSHWRRKEAPAFDPLILGLALPRRELYRRIDERVDQMFASGFAAEVKSLLKMGYGRDLPSMSGIGYREMCEYLAGECAMESAVERTKTRTHRLARHQNSWFKKSDERIRWVQAETGGTEDQVRAVAEFLGRRVDS
jgi:tRNA dimethylallyltransferase